MKAKISQNSHYVLVDLSGFINYESVDELKKAHFNQLKNSRVVFNLENLKFVGSSGVTDFVELLKELKSENLHICSAQPEFYRIFESQSLQVYAFHNSALEAHNHIESLRHVTEQMTIPGHFIGDNEN